MTKIKKITLSNLKAISEISADFNGCTALITGGNNKGKTTFLRSIPDRIRFIRPDVIVKSGEKEGKGELELTNGERFIWEFNDSGKDKLTFITTEGIRQSVTVELGSKFFPKVFDIDKFLQSPPKKQAEQLQAIIGLDFTEIDERYKKAYDERTARNRDAERYQVKLSAMLKVPHVEFVDLTRLKAQKETERTRLNNLYLENKKANDEARDKWNKMKEDINKDVADFNAVQVKNRQKYNACFDALQILVAHEYSNSRPADAFLFVETMKEQIKNGKTASDLYPPEPTYIEEMPDKAELDRIDDAIMKATETNVEAQKHQDYVEYATRVEVAKDVAKEADELVIAIEQERLRMIESANMPKGIEITAAGILVDGLPLDRNQISTSKLYTSALRIAAMNLGEVKTLHFDASFLDKNSLAAIEQWANENDLQLLIERPDFSGGEIEYQIIS